MSEAPRQEDRKQEEDAALCDNSSVLRATSIELPEVIDTSCQPQLRPVASLSRLTFPMLVRQRLGLGEVGKAPKDADTDVQKHCASCRKDFGVFVRRRVTCALCQQGFCRGCIRDSRKIPEALDPFLEYQDGAAYPLCKMCSIRTNLAPQCAKLLTENRECWPVIAPCGRCGGPSLELVCFSCEDFFCKVLQSLKDDVVKSKRKSQLLKVVSKWNGVKFPMQVVEDLTQKRRMLTSLVVDDAIRIQASKDVTRDKFLINGALVTGEKRVLDTLENALQRFHVFGDVQTSQQGLAQRVAF